MCKALKEYKEASLTDTERKEILDIRITDTQCLAYVKIAEGRVKGLGE